MTYPRSEGLSIVLLVVERGGVSRACGGRFGGVEAERHVFAVHVVGEGLHAAGKAGGVGGQRSRRVARGGGCHPAVVDVDAVVAVLRRIKKGLGL